MVKIRFNCHPGLRIWCPTYPRAMKSIPFVGDYVRLSSTALGKVTKITHLIDDPVADVEVYLSLVIE